MQESMSMKIIFSWVSSVTLVKRTEWQTSAKCEETLQPMRAQSRINKTQVNIPQFYWLKEQPKSATSTFSPQLVVRNSSGGSAWLWAKWILSHSEDHYMIKQLLYTRGTCHWALCCHYWERTRARKRGWQLQEILNHAGFWSAPSAMASCEQTATFSHQSCQAVKDYHSQLSIRRKSAGAFCISIHRDTEDIPWCIMGRCED